MIALLAETDGHFRLALAEGLEQYGVAVEVVATGDEVLRNATDRDYSAIVLASQLPDYEAPRLCRKIRGERVDSPIIVLVDASDPIETRVAGLDSGADDCLTWPISCRELAARIRAVRRRGSIRDESMLTCGDLKLDHAGHRVWRGETLIDLTPTEFTVLEVLMQHQGTVLRPRFLLEHAWGTADPHSNVVPVYIRYLRNKIDHPFGRSSLQTVRRVGYRLMGDG